MTCVTFVSTSVEFLKKICNLVPRVLFPGLQSQGKVPWGRGWKIWALPNHAKDVLATSKHCGRCSDYFQGLLNVDVQSAKSWHHLAKIMEAKYHEILPRSSLHTQDCKYLSKITYLVVFFSGIVHYVCKIILLYACDQSFWSAGVKNTHNVSEVAGIV